MILLTITTACTEKAHENALAKRLSEQRVLWESLAKPTFLISSNYNQLSAFVQATENILSRQETPEQVSSDELTALNLFAHHFIHNQGSTHEAALERSDKLAKMFIAHQATVFTELAFNEQEKKFLDINSDVSLHIQQYVNTLTHFVSQHSVFTNGDFAWYEVDDQTKVMAYQRQYQNTRAYIAFNFSFDTVDMPFPFGFMNSTKITLWQSDAKSTERFVTQGSLPLRPFTATVVIVE